MPEHNHGLYRSWPEIVDLLHDDPTEEDLSEILAGCLLLESWDANPEDTQLFPFLARCWPYAQLRLKIHNAISMWSRERRQDFLACITGELPAHMLNGQRTMPATTTDAALEGFQLHIDGRGQLKETFYNYAMILQHHSHWRGRIRFNAFANVPTLDNAPISDAVEGEIAEWFGLEYGLGGNQYRALRRAIDTTASKRAYDPLKEYLAGLPMWDQKQRLNTWLCDWCGGEPTLYTAWVGRVLILQMLARALEPGCIARYVVIFEGQENTGKTRCIHTLGHPWAVTFDMSMDSKEAHMMMQGTWVAELCELDTLRKTTETRLKSFISQREDAFVPKYSNNLVQYQRRTVFIGSTNEDEYLQSMTGNTRFLPARTGVFNIAALEKHRAQLFAEGLTWLQENPREAWWEPPASVATQVMTERSRRRVVNEYQGPLGDWLNGDWEPPTTARDETTWQDIAKGFLKIESPEKWKDKSLQAQITTALKGLGWEREDRGRGKKVWKRPQVSPG